MLTLLASVALAGECKNIINVPLATDTEHVEYRTHRYDVASYAKEHRLGFKDFAPLKIDAGSGKWCYYFGTLRPFEQIMGATGIVVTVGGKRIVRLDTDRNEFWVNGLSVGDTVRIEFIQPIMPASARCDREVNTSMTTMLDGGRVVPATYYHCDVGTVTWRVVEERLFTTNPADNISN